MNFDGNEQESLQRAICSAANMAPELAALPEIPQLQSIEDGIDQCRSVQEMTKAHARHAEHLTQRVKRLGPKRGFDDLLDPTGKLAIALQRGIDSLKHITDRVEPRLQNVEKEIRRAGESHNLDLFEALKDCCDSMVDFVDMLVQLRAALIARDTGEAEVELSSEQFERVQRCMEIRKDPSPRIAASVDKMLGILRGPSLSS